MGVALVIGFITSRFVYHEMTTVATVKTVSTMRLVIATVPMPLGTRLQASQLAVIEWPSAAPLPGSFSRIEDCAGRALLTNVVPSEPILDQKLAPREAGAGLPAVIPEGMRALSVRVDDVVGVAGFVVPGTMVDVLATGDAGGTNGGDVLTRTILEDVRVLAAGQQTTQDKDGKPQTVAVVTLLVDPDQADRLTLASNEGKLRLALRNTIDTKQLDPPPVYRSTVFYGRAATPPRLVAVKHSAPPKPVADPYTVEVIKGDKEETQTFGASASQPAAPSGVAAGRPAPPATAAPKAPSPPVSEAPVAPGAPVTRSVWSALQPLGFSGGKTLEPAPGAGVLVPSELAGFTGRIGIKIDPMSSAIAKHLIQIAQYPTMGYRDVPLPNGHFDATAGSAFK